MMNPVNTPAGVATEDGAGGSDDADTLGSVRTPNTPHALHSLRKPGRDDGFAIHQLIGRCPPLDQNTVYAYLLLCEHFSQTCVVAEKEGEIEGFLSAYILPERKDTLFIWQLAVDASARGQGLAQRMLQSVLARPVCEGIRYLETTVGPENLASRGVFRAFTQALSTQISEAELFESRHFGPLAHDDEPLLKIGPFINSYHK